MFLGYVPGHERIEFGFNRLKPRLWLKRHKHLGIVKTFVYGLLAASFLLALFQPEILVFAITLAALIGASGF